jgi:hypothetical protein
VRYAASTAIISEVGMGMTRRLIQLGWRLAPDLGALR